MSSRFWAILGVIAAVFIGVAIVNSNNKEDGSSTATVSNHVTGKSEKNIKLVEYGDFQCPYCAQAYPIVKQVTEKYKDQITFQFINYPLQNAHQNAFAAARAAEAASKQGKFWEMYDLLYVNQASWSGSNSPQSTFEGYAKGLGLDAATFKKDYISKAVNDTINADMQSFEKLDITISTPTFLLNGKQIKPDNTVESFSKIIDEALAAKQ
jgi:protein-disulfide isomerase